jgi:ornithine carbamoyltransferase
MLDIFMLYCKPYFIGRAILKGKDLISITDLAPETILSLLNDAIEYKNGRRPAVASGKVMALLFEKPSLRTRTSFEIAMISLGGHSIYLSPAEVGLGKRESVSDVARVLDRYVDVIVTRTFSHSTVEELAKSCSIPVINALSDFEHPCQALADVLTILEKRGEIKGTKIAFIGDGNNVAHSLMLISAMLGADFSIATPKGYEVHDDVLELAVALAYESGSKIECTDSPVKAVSGADVIYTDAWTSMGQEQESQQRRQTFAGYQVNSSLLCHAPERVMVMHCLPAHRGEEITDDVIDSPHSVIFDQAENRLHATRALLAYLLGGLEISIG